MYMCDNGIDVASVSTIFRFRLWNCSDSHFLF